ncbi:MAG: imelysin family protein [Myxococcota bacterium]|nr:imelysin family protein [Myxococcota bacterium]
MKMNPKTGTWRSAVVATLGLWLGASCGTSQLDDSDQPTSTQTERAADNETPAVSENNTPAMATDTMANNTTTDEPGTTEQQDEAVQVPERPATINDQVAVEYILEYVVQAQLDEFVTEAAALDTAVRALAESPDEAERLDIAQAQWKSAMTVWQRLELMRFGPTGGTERLGGKALGNFVYIINGANLCMVDQVVARSSYKEEGWIDDVLTGYNVQGLGAMEYLLFYGGTDSQCKPNHKLIVDGEWDVVKADPTQLKTNRFEYAAVLSAKVNSLSQALKAEWTDQAFGSSFAQGSTPYNGYQSVLDEVFAGLFYLDKKVKDLKLATPLGLTAACEAECQAKVEFPHSGFSKAALRANLVAAKHIFQGGPQPGFVGLGDLLVEKSADSLAETLAQKIDAAIAAIDAVEGSLTDAVVQRPGQVQAAYDAVKAITDDLKGPFVTILSLTVPAEGKGDSD